LSCCDWGRGGTAATENAHRSITDQPRRTRCAAEIAFGDNQGGDQLTSSAKEIRGIQSEPPLKAFTTMAGWATKKTENGGENRFYPCRDISGVQKRGIGGRRVGEIPLNTYWGWIASPKGKGVHGRQVRPDQSNLWETQKEEGSLGVAKICQGDATPFSRSDAGHPPHQRPAVTETAGVRNSTRGLVSFGLRLGGG